MSHMRRLKDRLVLLAEDINELSLLELHTLVKELDAAPPPPGVDLVATRMLDGAAQVKIDRGH